MTCKQNLFPTKWPMAILITIVMLAGSVLAVGQTERVVYRFQGGSDGLDPAGGLISDNAGNFYGTTLGGGPDDYGTVFQLAAQGGHWTKTVLYAFTGGNDGGYPFGQLIFDQAGNLYGTGLWSGGFGCCGIVFELKPQGSSWTESVIYTTPGNAELCDGLVFDQVGNLYGATYAGGEQGIGQVFQLAPSQGGGWTETTIHSFTGRADGSRPLSGTIIGGSGNLFGVMQQGSGNNHWDGAVYELKHPVTQGGAWTERVLYNFVGNGNDGAEPSGRLVFDRKGNLDGVTRLGGPSNQGTVFQLTRQGGSWTEAVLYSFCAQSNCTDGAQPQAGLIVDGKGNLYGTTLGGGTGSKCGNNSSCGTVFELTPQAGAWTETVLHNFTGGGGDGYLPVVGLAHGKSGRLWGTTQFGGKLGEPCTSNNGCGTVFKIHP